MSQHGQSKYYTLLLQLVYRVAHSILNVLAAISASPQQTLKSKLLSLA